VWLKDHNLDPAFGVQEAFCRSEYNGKSVTHSKEIVCIIRAWMYIGIPSFWDPLITAYDWGAAETLPIQILDVGAKHFTVSAAPLPK